MSEYFDLFSFKNLIGLTAAIAIVIVVLFATMALIADLRRMKFSKARDDLLKQIALEVNELLTSHSVKFLEATNVWIYGYPKIKLLFETEADIADAKKSGKLELIAQHITQSIHDNPVFGRGRKQFDKSQSLLIVCKESERQYFNYNELN